MFSDVNQQTAQQVNRIHGTLQASSHVEEMPARPSKQGRLADTIWTLAFFPVSCGLTQKALQDRKIVTHLSCLLAGSLQEGARMLVAVLTDDIG